jgi:hypothetical protein
VAVRIGGDHQLERLLAEFGDHVVGDSTVRGGILRLTWNNPKQSALALAETGD